MIIGYDLGRSMGDIFVSYKWHFEDEKYVLIEEESRKIIEEGSVGGVENTYRHRIDRLENGKWINILDKVEK